MISNSTNLIKSILICSVTWTSYTHIIHIILFCCTGSQSWIMTIILCYSIKLYEFVIFELSEWNFKRQNIQLIFKLDYSLCNCLNAPQRTANAHRDPPLRSHSVWAARNVVRPSSLEEREGKKEKKYEHQSWNYIYLKFA